MIDEDYFRKEVVKKKESEWVIPFEDLDMDVGPYETDKDLEDRKDVIQDKQQQIVEWCEDIQGCNWSVGFIDDEEQNAMVVKWWFKEQDYPVVLSEE